MKETSVYIEESEVERLRHPAAASGRSQADLIRDGISLVLKGEPVKERVFHSLGRGQGDGTPYRRWSSDKLHRSVTGRE
ncbi:MAG TPA: ribbon-helix-helix domain-containing protein [Chloroflexota bacterium]|jgi:hypothetical protein|nr:ribbon-helix-helix domain-containing protein [Chloroflexota bacterium]